jgi:hypothetical protein
MGGANPRHDARFEKYKSALLRYVAPREMRGLEIGAFDLPFIEPDEGNVEFLDYATSEELREQARSAEGHSPDFVAPVKYVATLGDWADVPEGHYDWIAAAHVIEHAPSMIDWLRTAARRLKNNGILFLVIPDKRYTFDYFRPESTLGKILEDHVLGKVRPGPAEVFDSHYYTRDLDPDDLWKKEKAIVFDPQPASGAMDLMSSTADQYIDVHCNIFSQSGFTGIINTLCGGSFVPFYVDDIGTVDKGGIDFHCVLRRNLE